MRLLSIDVGMKYLAYCLFLVEDNHYTIADWGILNLCDDGNKHKCHGKMKNDTLCKRKSRFHKNGLYYCKIHAKNKPYHIPTNDMKYIKLKNKKILELKQYCKERKYMLKKKPRKKDYLEAIAHDLSNNYFDFVKTMDSRKIDLITYGRHIKEQFTKKFKSDQVDCVLVETQVGPLALRMKVLQGMIMQHFIENHYAMIKEVSPINKLKEFIKDKKTTYRERKKLSILETKKILDGQPALNSWVPFYTTHRKKDDLADAFLQGRWYIKEKLPYH